LNPPIKQLREAIYDYAEETSNQEAAKVLREEATCLEDLNGVRPKCNHCGERCSGGTTVGGVAVCSRHCEKEFIEGLLDDE